MTENERESFNSYNRHMMNLGICIALTTLATFLFLLNFVQLVPFIFLGILMQVYFGNKWVAETRETRDYSYDLY